MEKYLESSLYIDWQEPTIKSLAFDLSKGLKNDIDIAKSCFEYVRDNIQHSWDYKRNPVTIKASDVKKYGTGYCYAKSHLLAALLRANGIPTGLCYQRLTITHQAPFCIHGLNAVYLQNYGWYRIDARGNKDGVEAEFCPPIECLAFKLIQPGEMDIDGIFSSPHPVVVSLLQSCDTVENVYERLSESDFIKNSLDSAQHGQ